MPATDKRAPGDERPLGDERAFNDELRRMREGVQAFVEARAEEGVGTWPLAAALGEKAIEILAMHHGRQAAAHLLDGLRETLERAALEGR